MRGSFYCILLPVLCAASPASGLTLYKCVLLDGGGIVYQEEKPDASECVIEKKELDPNANVIPAADFIGGKQPAGPDDGTAAPATSGDGAPSETANQ